MIGRTIFALIGDHHWERRASCADEDPALFEQMTKRELGIAGGGNGEFRPRRVERIAEALDCCQTCPVWKQCAVTRANFSDQLEPVAGVYGRQYVTVELARARRRRAIAREKRLGFVRRIARVRVITRYRNTSDPRRGSIAPGPLRNLGRSA